MAGALAPATAGAQPTVIEFATVGTQTFVVPDGVTEVTVEAFGAQGGAAATDPVCTAPSGGLGGSASTTIAVSAGETLEVTIGGMGASGDAGGGGGSNGGGDSGVQGTVPRGGGGGGASDVRRAPFGLADRLVAGAGGGGGGSCDQAPPVFDTPGGAGGGAVGGPGGSATGATGGGGGMQATGGAFGVGGAGGSNGIAGIAGDGGNGGAGLFRTGGGGGSGLFGGGGGGGSNGLDSSGGGGGGSSFPTAATQTGVRAGNGLVRVTVTAAVSPTTAAGPTAVPVSAQPRFTG